MFQALSRKRFLLWLLPFCVLTLFVYMSAKRSPKIVPRMCYVETDLYESDYSRDGPQRLEDVQFSDKIPPPGRTIFFHETRCHTSSSKYIFNLSARQACAIESAALHNPNFQVFVLFSSSTYLSDDQKNPILDALRSYKNVHLRQLNIWRYAKDTPIEDWFKKGDLFRSK